MSKDEKNTALDGQKQSNIDSISFFEIGGIRGGSPHYIRGGKSTGNGPVESYDAEVLKAILSGDFPAPNKKPKRIERAPSRPQTPMSIQSDLRKCLYIFSIEDVKNVSFSRTRAPFDFGTGSGNMDPQKYYSDCRLYSINSKDELVVTIPSAKPLPPGKQYPRATWAGFVFDGAEAYKLSKDKEFIFPFTYFVDEDDGGTLVLRSGGGGTDTGFPGGDEN